MALADGIGGSTLIDLWGWSDDAAPAPVRGGTRTTQIPTGGDLRYATVNSGGQVAVTTLTTAGSDVISDVAPTLSALNAAFPGALTLAPVGLVLDGRAVVVSGQTPCAVGFYDLTTTPAIPVANITAAATTATCLASVSADTSTAVAVINDPATTTWSAVDPRTGTVISSGTLANATERVELSYDGSLVVFSDAASSTSVTVASTLDGSTRSITLPDGCRHASSALWGSALRAGRLAVICGADRVGTVDIADGGDLVSVLVESFVSNTVALSADASHVITKSSNESRNTLSEVDLTAGTAALLHFGPWPSMQFPVFGYVDESTRRRSDPAR
ncbi:MAG: hypothetical protein GX868_03615 [Actinobacteria bacterium]|nr:hypothetical protein [Actinomycetota bacterium]